MNTNPAQLPLRFIKLSLTSKLILAFMLVAITAASLVAVFLHLSSPERLNQLIFEQNLAEFKAAVVEYYEQTGSLENIGYYLVNSGMMSPSVDSDSFSHPAERMLVRIDRQRVFVLATTDGIILFSNLPWAITGLRVSNELLERAEPIVVDGQHIGLIIYQLQDFTLTPEEEAYLVRTNQAVLLSGVGGVLVALLAGVWLARNLTRPLRDLTLAADRIASGQLEQVVTVRSKDEIGHLTEAFNNMSSQVAQANMLRRQMTADIAHDLRTPLTVIAGFVEAMRDEILAPTPERLNIIYSEIERLQRLVEDLRTLTRADSGNLGLNQEFINVADLIERQASAHQLVVEQKGISLRVEKGAVLPKLYADEARLSQVLDNLITNAIRYTPSGGQITLRVTTDSSQKLLIEVADTGVGIQPEDLPYVFDRFYRADKSRTDDDGASGLGLAIVKALVQAHGGTIHVDSIPGEGSSFRMLLPIATA
jgi:signal transduction histidine kinase